MHAVPALGYSDRGAADRRDVSALPEREGAPTRARGESTRVTAGQLLRVTREQAGLTQTQLAEIARTKQSSVSRIETDTISPTLATLERMIEATGMGTLMLSVRRRRR